MCRVIRKIIICYFCTSVQVESGVFSLSLSLSLFSGHFVHHLFFFRVRLYFMSSRADFYTKKQNILNMWMFGKFFYILKGHVMPVGSCISCSQKNTIFWAKQKHIWQLHSKSFACWKRSNGQNELFSLGFLFNNTLRPDRPSSLGVGTFGKGKASKDIWSVIIVTYCFRLLGIPFIFHNFHSSWDFSSYFLTGLWWPLRCPFRTTYIKWQVFFNRW